MKWNNLFYLRYGASLASVIRGWTYLQEGRWGLGVFHVLLFAFLSPIERPPTP